MLVQLVPSPVVGLNRAVAVAMADGLEQGLALLDALGDEDTLRTYYLLPAARADLLRRAGRDAEAAQAYHLALTLVENHRERRYLTRRLHEVQGRAN